MTNQCPVCSSAETQHLFPKYQGRCVTSQNYFLDDVTLDNRICKDCGFIYNARGVRGMEDSFYTPEGFKPKRTILSFDKKVQTFWERALDQFLEMVELPKTGAILDFGAGTGAFLSLFAERLPDWKLSALEPGGGYEQLVGRVNLEEAFNKPYHMLDLNSEYDCIVCMAVLEHLNNPFEALRWMREHLARGGVVFIQHPNVAKLPGDLFCADHINKLTVPHTKAMCEAAGFEVLAVEDSGVPFTMALRAVDRFGPLQGVYGENLVIASEVEALARSMVGTATQAVEAARRTGNKCAMFGTSAIGLIMPEFLDAYDVVACYVDENIHMWCDDLGGIPVVGLDGMAELDVHDIALMISPLYHKQVREKLLAYDVRVYTLT